MKILAFSDLHSGPQVLTNLNIYLQKEKFDLALIAGDITNPGSNALEYITALAKIFSRYNLPWLCVHGNNDRQPVIDYLISNHLDLHFHKATFGSYHLVGIGGWGDELPPYKLKFDEKTIFITHIPPRTNSKPPTLISQPILHISGHIHTWQRFYDIGKTRIINLPSVKFTNTIAIIALPERSVEFISLPQIKSYL